MFPERVGLVHISGIDRTDLPPNELTEPDRGLVFGTDRAGNVAQLQSFIGAGYGGFVSIEPFNPVVQQDPGLASQLADCINHVRAKAGAAGTKVRPSR